MMHEFWFEKCYKVQWVGTNMLWIRAEDVLCRVRVTSCSCARTDCERNSSVWEKQHQRPWKNQCCNRKHLPLRTLFASGHFLFFSSFFPPPVLKHRRSVGRVSWMGSREGHGGPSEFLWDCTASLPSPSYGVCITLKGRGCVFWATKARLEAQLCAFSWKVSTWDCQFVRRVLHGAKPILGEWEEN